MRQTDSMDSLSLSLTPNSDRHTTASSGTAPAPTRFHPGGHQTRVREVRLLMAPDAEIPWFRDNLEVTKSRHPAAFPFSSEIINHSSL